MIVKNKIKAILFDWDDTIAQTHTTVGLLYQNYVQAQGLPRPSLAEVLQHWGKPKALIAALLVPGLGVEEADKKFMEHVPEGFSVKPFEGVEATLHTLKQKGYILGVVSSGPKNGIQNSLHTFVNHSGLFAFIYSAEDCEFHKPDPRVFDGAMSKLQEIGITESEVLYVGDSLHDYVAAHERGIRFAAVLTGFTTREQFLEIGVSKQAILQAMTQIPA